MPVFRVFMEYNRPMYGEFYIGMEQGKELDDFVIENSTTCGMSFLSPNNTFSNNC